MYIIILANEIFLYLFTIAAIISVPPVLPLDTNTNPIPEPHRIPPIIADIKGCSSTKASFMNKGRIDKNEEHTITLKIVRMQN